MTTKSNNLGRNLFIILFTAQISVLNIGCKYLEGNELLNAEDVAETNTREITEEIEVKDSVEIRKEQVLEIAEIEWKSELHEKSYLKLSHPTVENGVVKGSIEIKRTWGFFTGTYEKLSENNYSIHINDGTNDILSIEPIDDGNSIQGKWYAKGSETPYQIEKFVRE